jgi:hypothetical protein
MSDIQTRMPHSSNPEPIGPPTSAPIDRGHGASGNAVQELPVWWRDP